MQVPTNITFPSTMTNTNTVKNNETITIAGRTFDLSTGNYIVLSSSAAAANFDTLQSNNADYQVPVGYKLTLLACRVVTYSATAAMARFGSADATCSNGASPAGYAVLSSGGGGISLCMTTATAGAYAETLLPSFEVTAGKYPTVEQIGGTAAVIVIAKVEAV